MIGLFCFWEWKVAKLPIVPSKQSVWFRDPEIFDYLLVYIFRYSTVIGVYVTMFVKWAHAIHLLEILTRCPSQRLRLLLVHILCTAISSGRSWWHAGARWHIPHSILGRSNGCKLGLCTLYSTRTGLWVLIPFYAQGMAVTKTGKYRVMIQHIGVWLRVWLLPLIRTLYTVDLPCGPWLADWYPRPHHLLQERYLWSTCYSLA